MDAYEFANCVRPAGARSRMAPFLDQLRQLREGDYTLAQLQDFLRRNGVEVSVAAVSAYLIRHALTPRPPSDASVDSPGAVTPAREREASEPAPVTAPPAASAAGVQGLLRGSPADLDSLIRQGRRMKPK